jgi:hypothetical protein
MDARTTNRQQEVDRQKYSVIVQQALADPDGARHALWHLGEILDFPPGGMPPIPVNRGRESWTRALINAPELWLGLAWETAEERYGPIGAKTEGQSAQAEGEDMKPLAWVEKSSGDSKMPQPGMYKARVASIKETYSELYKVDQFEFTFAIIDDQEEDTGETIRGWCSQKWGPSTKLYEWSRVFLGSECPQGGQFGDEELAMLNGCLCDLEVTVKNVNDPESTVKLGKLYPYDTMTRKAPTRRRVAVPA